MRWQRYGDPLGEPSRLSAVERFWASVDKTDIACWLWAALTDDNGYGRFWNGTKVVLAHVFSYELLVGSTPGGLDHRHTCPKNCVRPEHLRPATQKQNMENRAGANSNNHSSGIRGVTWNKQRGKWQVGVMHNGKYYYGGLFPSDRLAEAEVAAIALRNRLFTHNDADREIEHAD